ncbi:UNVERIFIED_CONTAM: hypothetical protein RMT77_006417 [Armadillidium vulgare]
MKLLFVCLVTLGVFVPSIFSEEPKPTGEVPVEENKPQEEKTDENGEESHREGKLFKGDSVLVQKPFFSWPFADGDKTQQPSPEVEKMQGRFFSVVKSSGSITPLEMLIDTLKRTIPECIQDIERIVENFERYVNNNQGVTEFDPRQFTDLFQAIVQQALTILSQATAVISNMAAPTSASMAFF